MANLLNKNFQYKILLEYWQNQLNKQNNMLEETKDVIKEQEIMHITFEKEEKILVDNFYA